MRFAVYTPLLLSVLLAAISPAIGSRSPRRSPPGH